LSSCPRKTPISHVCVTEKSNEATHSDRVIQENSLPRLQAVWSPTIKTAPKEINRKSPLSKIFSLPDPFAWRIQQNLFPNDINLAEHQETYEAFPTKSIFSNQVRHLEE